MTIDPRAPSVRQTQLHLSLTARSRTEAGPGRGISLCCRIHSRAPETVVGAMLRFVLPPEVVVAAGDPAGIILAPLEAGGSAAITHEIRIHDAVADGTELRFEVTMTLPDGQLHRSNVAAIRVRKRARLNGPGTFVRVVRASTMHELVVEARITNDGSAPARLVTIDLPPPAGTRPVDALIATSYTFDEIEPGAARTFSYRVRIAVPTLRSVRAADASLHDGAGNRIALAPSPELPLAPAFSMPKLSATRERRRLHCKLQGRNDGAGSARGVEFALHWPAGFTSNAAALTWNSARMSQLDRHDAFARAAVRDDGADIAIASIDAGETYELGFELEATAVAGAGTLAVDMHAGEFALRSELALEWSPVCDIRLRVADAPDEAVDVGTPAQVVVELINAGDNDTVVAFEANGAQARLASGGAPLATGAPVPLAAGDRTFVTAAIDIPLEARDGESVTMILVACVHDEEVARVAFTVRARNRVWIDAQEWLSIEDGAGFVQFGNTGTTIARNTVLASPDGERIDIGDIAPGAIRRVPISAADCARVGRGASLIVDDKAVLRLETGTPEAAELALAGVDAIVRVPARALAGAVIPVALHVVCTQSIRRLTIRAESLDTLEPIDGSLRVDDQVNADSTAAPVLYAPGGLVLREVAAGAHIDLHWGVRGNAGGATGLRIRVDVLADGRAKSAFSQPLTIDLPASDLPATEAFSVAPVEEQPLVDARPAVGSPAGTVDASGVATLRTDDRELTPSRDRSALDEGATLFLALDRPGIDSCIELLSAKARPGVFSHLCAVRGLFPTSARGADDTVADALQSVHDAFESLFDRLALKLRMPNFTPTLRDCDDERSRRAMCKLLAACARIVANPALPDAGARTDLLILEVTVDPLWAQLQMARLANAQLGDPVVVSGTIALVPRASNRVGLHRALEHYAGLLRVAFSSPSDIFGDGVRGTLDTARERLVDALIDVRSDVAVSNEPFKATRG